VVQLAKISCTFRRAAACAVIMFRLPGAYTVPEPVWLNGRDAGSIAARLICSALPIQNRLGENRA
jgi:hypothetical protein